jgi:hypothetical protein
VLGGSGCGQGDRVIGKGGLGPSGEQAVSWPDRKQVFLAESVDNVALERL